MSLLARIAPIFFSLVLFACSSTAQTSTSTPEATPGRQSPWVRDRVKAVQEVYNLTPEGRKALDSLDVRQMAGRPTWYGSTGYKGWAGVGEARFGSVVHELGHAYWGLFPVSGAPHLSWDVPKDSDASSAMRQYRLHLRAFMAQPPDSFEPLRERLRNLPDLSTGSYADLYHFGEADMLTMTGGDLSLVPPILRKYFDAFLRPGPFDSWRDAIAWYLGLPPKERLLAEAYFALSHFPLDRYSALKPERNTHLDAQIRGVLEGEERQRLKDFAAQFDLISTNQEAFSDAAGVYRGFPFWRGYLRDMLSLYKKYPEALRAAPQGTPLARVLDLFLEAEKLKQDERASYFARVLLEPFASNFIPLVDNRTLLRLADVGVAPAGQETVRRATSAFVEDLKRYIRSVDHILNLGKTDLQGGAESLESLVLPLSAERGRDLDIIGDLFRSADIESTRRITARLPDDTIRRMLRANSAATRSMVSPERLLGALNITTQATPEEVIGGIQEMLKLTSGNFAIDRPYLEETYKVIAGMAKEDPAQAIRVLSESQMPLTEFIFSQSSAFQRLAGANLEGAAALLLIHDNAAVTPARLIHDAVYVDPALAAQLLLAMEKGRDGAHAIEVLAHMAYDSERLSRLPGLRLSIRNDAVFLRELLRQGGEPWLTRYLTIAVKKYDAKIREGEMDTQFIKAWSRTLVAVVEVTEAGEKEALLRLIRHAFKEIGQGIP